MGRMPRDAPLLVILGVAFVAAMFLAAAEAALLRIPPVRVASLHAGTRRSRRLARLLENLPRVLNAVLLAALLSQITAATVAGLLTQRWFGTAWVTVGSVVLTLLLFVYGEAIPKTFAVRHPDRVGTALATPLSWLTSLLRPLVAALVWIADVQMPGKGIATAPTVTEDELRLLASRAAREGEITDRDLSLIERGFRFGDRDAADVMVPRTDIVGVDDSATVEDALITALDAGHRRLPIYDGSLENVTGVVQLRDLVRVPAPQRSVLSVMNVASDPLIVPESKQVFALLEEMQTSGTHLAIVVDEYGGTAGLVTIEDIAEELLGSMTADAQPPAIAEYDGGWSIDAALPVDDLAELLETELPEGDWTTAAGLVLGLAGRVLDVGEEVTVGTHRLRVLTAHGRRLRRLAVLPDEKQPSR